MPARPFTCLREGGEELRRVGARGGKKVTSFSSAPATAGGGGDFLVARLGRVGARGWLVGLDRRKKTSSGEFFSTATPIYGTANLSRRFSAEEKFQRS